MKVLITGTSSGIGKALAKKYLDAGHTVYGISRSNTWKSKSTNFTWIPGNLTDRSTFNLSKRINESYLDRIICNAGSFSENACEFNEAHNQIVLQLQNRLTKSSRIIQISSIFHIANGDYLRHISPTYHAYCKSKQMQIDWCSIWNRCSNIEAVAIHPGAVKTKLFSDLYFFKYFADLVTITPETSAQLMYDLIEQEVKNDVVQEKDQKKPDSFTWNITKPFLLSK